MTANELPGLKPLAGKQLLVTRPKHQAAELIALIEARGGSAVSVPLINIAAPSNPELLDSALRRLGDYDWLVFTSRNTVDWVGRRLQQLEVTVPDQLLIAAVGSGTAAALFDYNLPVHLVPGQARWQGLADALAARAKPGQRLLLPRSARAGDELPQALRAAGLVVDAVEAYRTEPVAEAPAQLRAALSSAAIDAIVFTSASAIEEFVAALDEPDSEHLWQQPQRPLVACIGPNTAEVAAAARLPVDVVPAHAELTALIAALAEALAARTA